MSTYSFILVAIVYYLNCNRTSVPAYQEVLVKFAVSVALQAVLFEGGVPHELSACSGVNNKFREAHVSLDFLVLWHQGTRT